MKGKSQSFGLLKVVCGLLVVGGCIGLDGKGVANLLGAGIRLAADSPVNSTKQCQMTFKDPNVRFNEFAVVQAVPGTQEFFGVTTGCSAGSLNAFGIFYSTTGPCGPWDYKKYNAFHGDGLKYVDIYHYKDAPSWMYEFWTTFFLNGD